MMTVHKLSAGDGYTYLTRQVASHDHHRERGRDLADYYTATGNPPGRWTGRGAAALGVTGRVSEAQMKALFGRGLHPDADELIAERLAADATPQHAEQVARLGRAFPAYDASSARKAVAGYDLVFTPVKSASLLWALGDEAIRRAVEEAHHEAVADVLGWLERHAAFTRAGDVGQAQIETRGLICAAFDHRDSRLGDPDLHTHLAVSNKVRGVDGVWRSLDGRALFHAGVAASERYNTRFEDALTRRLRVRFVDRRDTTGRDKRPVREVAGVPLELIRHFSRRRQLIEHRYGELLAAYRGKHGRTPPRAVQVKLAQQATLDTREGKPPTRAFGDQLAGWRAEAEQVIGADGVAQMLRDAIAQPTRSAAVNPDLVESLSLQVLATVAETRSTWSRWNLQAEAERASRGLLCPTRADRDRLVEAVVVAATGPEVSVRIAAPQLVDDPPELRRSDGESVFVPHASERYTTPAILAAEQRLVARARVPAFASHDPAFVDAVLDRWQATTGRALDAGQRAVVRDFATNPRALRLGIGPAGSGKTTAMAALAAVLEAQGRRLVPLATSAKAAQVLGAELGTRAENLHKFLLELDRRDQSAGRRSGSDEDDAFYRLDPNTVVLVDEVSMAGTLLADRLTERTARAGATVRGLGDPHQLDAVEGGGWVRLVAHETGAAELAALHRFRDPDKAAASLQLRAGDPECLGYFERDDRIRSGTIEDMVEAAYQGWRTDMLAGRTCVMTAASIVDVAALSARARLDRIADGQVEPDGVQLRDGNIAGVGDWIVTRRNDRLLGVRGTRDFVKNGDTWSIQARRPDGSLVVEHHCHRGRILLPAGYVAEHVELAYATTAHRAQGTTVDTEHPIVTPGLTREALYVMTTRARDDTTLYVVTDATLDPATDHPPTPPSDTKAVLCKILTTEGAEWSATETIRQTQADAESPTQGRAKSRYARAVGAVTLRTPQGLHVPSTERLTEPSGHRRPGPLARGPYR
ncbi:MAG TPA: MobF family relaxase [Nocardioidaceae bacterium]